MVDAGPLADDFLDMYTENVDRAELTGAEQAMVLLQAHQHGASATRIVQATGLPRPMVKRLVAARITDEAGEAIGVDSFGWTLDQLSELVDLMDDPDALARVAEAAPAGRFDHQIAWEHQRLANQAACAQVRTELSAAGVTVVDELPHGAVPLDWMLHDGQEIAAESHAACPGHLATLDDYDSESGVSYACADPAGNGHTVSVDMQPRGSARLAMLAHDGDEITAESHAACPGHIVTFYRNDKSTAVHMCQDPQANGHTYRFGSLAPAATATVAAPSDPATSTAEAASAHRRLVIAGNKRWLAAEAARRKWLTTFLSRKTASRAVTRWTTEQLLNRPGPLVKWMSGASLTLPFALLSVTVTDTVDAAAVTRLLDTATDRRLPLIQLAVIAAAYENAMDKQTWRTENSWQSDHHRRHAATWLGFLAELGYPLSCIEQAVRDNAAYTGETDPDTIDPDRAADPGEAAGDSAEELECVPDPDQ